VESAFGLESRRLCRLERARGKSRDSHDSMRARWTFMSAPSDA